MAVVSLGAPRSTRLRESLFVEGFRLMRERLTIYLAFALLCAAAAWAVLPHIDMYDILASHPTALVSTPPVSVVLFLALAALFFILPSAMRRIEPDFKMTALRALIAFATIAAVGAVTELGYAFAILPGIAAAVLLSQALIGALLRTREGAGPRDVWPAMLGSIRGSVAMTKTHFATTMCVIAASLLILLVPFVSALFVLAVMGAKAPPSLLVTAPLLLLTFVYFECVRYALIVRWYRRLLAGTVEEPLAVSP